MIINCNVTDVEAEVVVDTFQRYGMRLSSQTLWEILQTPNEFRRESETALAEVSPADCSAAAAFEDL
jgi:hypothetical protein